MSCTVSINVLYKITDFPPILLFGFLKIWRCCTRWQDNGKTEILDFQTSQISVSFFSFPFLAAGCPVPCCGWVDEINWRKFYTWPHYCTTGSSGGALCFFQAVVINTFILCNDFVSCKFLAWQLIMVCLLLYRKQRRVQSLHVTSLQEQAEPAILHLNTWLSLTLVLWL